MNDTINECPTHAFPCGGHHPVQDTILQKRVPAHVNDTANEYVWEDYGRDTRTKVEEFVNAYEAGTWRGVDWISGAVVVEPRVKRLREYAAETPEFDLTRRSVKRYTTTLVNSYAAEPTLEWDTLDQALEYVRAIAENGMTVTLAQVQ